MANPASVAETLSILAAKRAEWNAAISQLTSEQMVEPDVCGWWRVKDVIAHLGWYENQMVKMLQLRSLDTGTDGWDYPTDDRNDRIFQATRNDSLEMTIATEEATYQQLVQLIRGMSDDELSNAACFASMPPDWSAVELLRQNTWQHYADHLPDIQQHFSLR